MHESNLRATSARIKVLTILHENHKPLSVVNLLDLIRDEIPGDRSPDKVTLYRMMQDFERVGIVRQIDLRQGMAFYEIMPGSGRNHDHHHIVCTQCGVVEDVQQCLLHDSIEQAITNSKQFSASYDHTFEIFGICKNCSK